MLPFAGELAFVPSPVCRTKTKCLQFLSSNLLNTAWLDWLIFGSYLVGVFAFGIYMSRKEESPVDFFLASRRLPWYAIALSLFATNISSGSLVGLAGDGYRVGMAVGTLEWGALFGLFLLAFVFVPYYQRARVFTTPEFLELRYGVAARLLFSGAVILFEMFVSMPFLLYTGGLAIEVLFDVPLVVSVVAIALFVGVYTTFGGLGAVVWTDVVQGLLMIAGGIIVTSLGVVEIGGIGVLLEQAGEKLHVCLPADHPDYPFPATMIGGYFLVTVYFWCQNQTIVQRVLAARTEWDARMGAIAACYIKLLLPFLIVLPGVIAVVLFPDLDASDKALPTLINEVVPIGLRGLILAAVIASLMSSADSGLNSWATLFTCDFYQRLFDQRADPKRLVLVGRLASVLLLSVAVIRAPTLRGNESILQFFLNALAYLSSPVIVVFFIGLFWQKATSAAAVTTFLTAPFLCYVAQHMRQLIGWGPLQTSVVYWLPIAVAGSMFVMIGVSLVTKPKTAAALEGLLWRRSETLTLGTQLLRRRDISGGQAEAQAKNQIGFRDDHRLWAIGAFLLMVGIIWFLR